jgi:uncharacterized protein (DUF885 family)
VLRERRKFGLKESFVRSIAKYVFIAIIGAALLALGLALHSWYAKPLSINWFYTRSFVKFVLDEPELLTSLRLFEPLGIRGHNAKLSDSSLAADERRSALLDETLVTFKRYPSAELSGQDAISHSVFDYAMKQRLADERWRWHSFPVTQLSGVHTWLPSLMIQQQRVDDATDAAHFIARLNAFPVKMQQIASQIDARKVRGIVPPKFAVEKTLAQLDGFIALLKKSTNLPLQRLIQRGKLRLKTK